MKKVLVLGLASLFILTGCGKKEVVCTGKIKEEGLNAQIQVIATFKSNKVTDAKATMTFETEAIAKSYCGVYEFTNSLTEDESSKVDFACEGKTITFNGYQKLIGSEENKDLTGKTKAEFIKEMEKNAGVKCK